MHLCTRLFAFSFYCPLLVLFMFSPRKLHSDCPSERDITNKHIVQTSAISSAYVALGNIKSLATPNYGPFLSAPFTISCILPCVSVAGGVSRPRGGALVILTAVS